MLLFLFANRVCIWSEVFGLRFALARQVDCWQLATMAVTMSTVAVAAIRTIAVAETAVKTVAVAAIASVTTIAVSVTTAVTSVTVTMSC